VRAKIVLLAAEGLENTAIGQRLDMPRPVVSKWRHRFYRDRLAGLEERPRGGRPSTFSPNDDAWAARRGYPARWRAPGRNDSVTRSVLASGTLRHDLLHHSAEEE
jgi:transposase